MKRLCLFLGRIKFHLNMDAFNKKICKIIQDFFLPSDINPMEDSALLYDPVLFLLT